MHYIDAGSGSVDHALTNRNITWMHFKGTVSRELWFMPEYIGLSSMCPIFYNVYTANIYTANIYTLSLAEATMTEAMLECSKIVFPKRVI